MTWFQKLLQKVEFYRQQAKAYREVQRNPYPDPKNKYFQKIKVKSFGGDLKLLEEKHGIW